MRAVSPTLGVRFGEADKPGPVTIVEIDCHPLESPPITADRSSSNSSRGRSNNDGDDDGDDDGISELDGLLEQIKSLVLKEDSRVYKHTSSCQPSLFARSLGSPARCPIGHDEGGRADPSICINYNCNKKRKYAVLKYVRRVFVLNHFCSRVK
jgi:hypothetical protein